MYAKPLGIYTVLCIMMMMIKCRFNSAIKNIFSKSCTARF